MPRSHAIRLLITACILSGFAASARAQTAPDADSGVLRAFHIGNSLTYGVLTFPHAVDILSSPARRYVYGMQVLWGAPLSAIIDQQDTPSVKSDAFGTYPHALASFTWDVVTLQPSFAVMEGPKGDLAMARQLALLALAKSPQAQIYIYETWPSIGEKAPPGAYAAMWNRTYTPGAWDKALYSQDYCSRLVTALRQALPTGKPVRLIPVGHVLAALDTLARAGSIPGLTGIESIYRDGTHLIETGNFAAICTWYAVLRGEDPSHIPASLIPASLSPELARTICQTAWSTVTHDPFSGVAP
jgi:hypothetical protein